MCNKLINWFRKCLPSNELTKPKNVPKIPVSQVSDLKLTAAPTQLGLNLQPKKQSQKKKMPVLTKQQDLFLENDPNTLNKFKLDQQKK